MCGCARVCACVMSRILNRGLYLMISRSRKFIIHVLTKSGYSYQETVKFMKKKKEVLDETSKVDEPRGSNVSILFP